MRTLATVLLGVTVGVGIAVLLSARAELKRESATAEGSMSRPPSVGVAESEGGQDA